MPESQNTIMKKSEKSWTSVQCFKGLETVLLIQEGCLMSLEGNRMRFVAWNDLQIGFQNLSFQEKFQVFICFFCAAEWFLALGLACSLCMEWIRSKNLIKILELMNAIFDFFTMIFKSFFTCFCYQIMTNPIDSLHIWLGTKCWVYNMHKKI